MWPAPAETSAGRTPVGMVSTSRFESGSITASVFPVARRRTRVVSPPVNTAASAAASSSPPPRPSSTPPRRASSASERGACPRGRVELGVLSEDRSLQILELAAGLDAELLDECAPGVAVARQRVPLAARAVEREDQLGAQPLARRMLAHQCLQLWDQCRVAPQREVGLDALLERDQPQLLEAGDVALCERLVREIRERRAAPDDRAPGEAARSRWPPRLAPAHRARPPRGARSARRRAGQGIRSST